MILFNIQVVIHMILFNILESEDSYEDLNRLSQKLENTLSSYHLCLPILS